MSSFLADSESSQVAVGIHQGLRSYFPVTSKEGRLKLDVEKVWVDESKDPLSNDPGFLNRARHESKSYEVPVMADVALYVDGDLHDTYRTRIGSYFPKAPGLNARLIEGSVYQNKYQVRRKPGVYAFRNTKNQPKIEFNSSGTNNLEFIVDAKKNDSPTFDLIIKGKSDAIVTRGVYILLRAFGATDAEIKQMWGGLHKFNAFQLERGQEESAARPVDLREGVINIFHKLTRDYQREGFDSSTFESASKGLVDWLTERESFDRSATHSSLGVASSKFSKPLLMAAAKKLVGVYNGDDEIDSRFNEKYRRLHGIPTQLREGFVLDKELKNNVKRKVGERLNALDKQLSDGVVEKSELKARPLFMSVRNNFKKKIQSVYTNSDLSSTTETNNILDIHNRDVEVTIKGPGGIQSSYAVQPETIELHPSRLGLTDFVRTQPSAPGLTVPLANGAIPGQDGEIHRRLFDRKLGKIRTVTADEADTGGVGFPDDFNIVKANGTLTYKPKEKVIFGSDGDEVRRVDEKKVRYVIPDVTDMFADGTNIVPFLNHDSGPRAIMGANQMGQAISLTDPEAPLVDTVDGQGKTFSRRIGEKYNVVSDVSGTITDVQEDYIEITPIGGSRKSAVKKPLLRNFPLNQGGFIHHQPKVKKGDEVKKGDLLTKNNYTDDDGELAIGKNLMVAYMPFKGFNFEDGLVISESAARKLSSEHIKEYEIEITEDLKLTTRAYNGAFGDQGKQIKGENRMKLESKEFSGRKMDVIRKGETVEPGEVLFPAVGFAHLKNDPEITAQMEKMFGDLGLGKRDRSVYWDEEFPGEVIRVTATPTVVRIYVKSKQQFKEGDKITGRHGEKGIVSKVVPDDQMPQRKNPKSGEYEPVDMLVDPHGVPSRMNPGQILELAAGKLAHHTGKKYLVKNFEGGEPERIKAELDKHGLSDKEDLIDPTTGKTIPQVAVGYAYKAKLKHQLDKKFSVRGRGLDGMSYDLDEQPAGGGAVDNLTVYALIGHNARANLSEMTRLKGTANLNYWSQLANGFDPAPVAQVPFAFRKFEGMMKGLGVNIEKNRNDELKFVPMTDKDVERMSSGEIKSPQQYTSHRKGGPDAYEAGLFDPNLVGRSGKNWNHVTLPEPTPNPYFMKPIQLLLRNGDGLDGYRIQKSTGKEDSLRSSVAIRDVKDLYLKKATVVGPDGEEYTGGEGLKKLLAKVDLGSTEKSMRTKLEAIMAEKDFNPTTVSKYHDTLRYVANLKDNGIKAEEAYIMTKLPVMPPEFRRPLTTSDEKLFTPSVNTLYASLIAQKNNLEHGIENYEPEEFLDEYRQSTWQALAALIGGEGNNTKIQPVGNFEATSILSQLSNPKIVQGTGTFGQSDSSGGGPKLSYPQRKVLRKKQDLSGRSTIIPSGTVPLGIGGGDVQIEGTDALDVDELGIPEEMAWEVYEPFLRDRLTKQLGGQRYARQAAKEVAEQTPLARKMLIKEMEERPVLANRAPSWWPYNIMAFKPVLMDKQKVRGEFAEKAIRVPNLVVGPYFGGDFDGDTFTIHVPAEKEAVKEAFDMMPSKHLRAPGSKQLMIMPSQSQLLGLNLLTQYDVQKGVKSSPAGTTRKLVEMYRKGEIDVDQPVTMPDIGVITPGWAVIDRAIRRATGEKHGLMDLFDAYEKQQGERPDLQRFQLHKKNARILFNAMAEAFPQHYARIAQQLTKEGDDKATQVGFTVGLSDIMMDEKTKNFVNDVRKEHEALVPVLAKEIATERAKATKEKKVEVTPADIRAARVKLFTSGADVNGKAVIPAAKRVEDYLKEMKTDNTLIQMMQVGSKGNTGQIRQVLGAVFQVNDVHKNTVDEPIYNSYATGLKSGEYYVQQHGALSGLRDRAVETREPGYLGKQIVAASQDYLVTTRDCGTKSGIDLPLFKSDKDKEQTHFNPDLEGRYLAGSNQAVSPEVLHGLNREKKVMVEVRSPLTCEAERGVCQMCFGLTERGQLPPIGDNVGVREGQSIVESSTKMTLKSFHTGGGADARAPSFDRLQEVIQLSEPSFKAIMLKGPQGSEAEITSIDRISITGRKGTLQVKYKVHDKDGSTTTDTITLAPGQEILKTIKTGVRYPVGTAITHGDLDPSEVGFTKGFEAQRNYVTDALHEVIQGAGQLGRRTAETTVAAMGSYATVTNSGSSKFFPGDDRKVGQILAFNKGTEDEEEVDEDIVDRVLAREVNLDFGKPTLKAGHKLTPQDIVALKTSNVKTVYLTREKISFQRSLSSVLKVPQQGENWLAKMNFQNLASELQTAAIQGQSAEIHGDNPIASYMYGKEMDKGQNKNRWRY